MFSFELIQKKDLPDLFAFFGTVYKPGHIITDEEYFDWQYLQAPGNIHTPRYSNLVLRKNGDIKGHLGLIPYAFTRGIRAAFAASLIVAPELRSHGAGVFLLREAEKYFDFLYTTGYNAKAAPALKIQQWSAEQLLTRWVWRPTSSTLETEPEGVHKISSFDDTWDMMWQAHKKSFGATIERTSEYLNWRFVNNPKIAYTILGVGSSAENGYAVLRLEKGPDYTGLRIVDCIARDGALTVLLQQSIAVARELGADFVDFLVSGTHKDEVIEAAGFARFDPDINPEPPIFILPTDRESLTINYAFKYTGQLDIHTDEVYFTKADGDRDRAF